MSWLTNLGIVQINFGLVRAESCVNADFFTIKIAVFTFYEKNSH